MGGSQQLGCGGRSMVIGTSQGGEAAHTRRCGGWFTAVGRG